MGNLSPTSVAGGQRCVVFIHIPKTGGKTLSTAIRLKYGTDTITWDSRYQPLDRMSEIPIERRRAARAVTGHLHFGVDRAIGRDCDYLTVLREPVARVISMYNFIRGNPRNWLHHRVAASDIGLEEFAREAVDPTVDNEQTRLLSGRGSGDLLGLGPDGRLRAPSEPPREVTPQDLEAAKRNLERFCVVGLTERFDETFILIRRALGWRLPLYETRNVSRASADVPTPSAILAIAERNRFDLELYAHGRRLFEDAVARQPASFKPEVAAFRILNRVPSRLGPRLPSGLRDQVRAVLSR